MKIDEGVNGKIHGKLRQMLNSKANFNKWTYLSSVADFKSPHPEIKR